jgi:GNAT superfamily N-acetyltransferase
MNILRVEDAQDEQAVTHLITEAGPLSAGIAYRVIEKSWLANYRRFIPAQAMRAFRGERHFRSVRSMVLSPYCRLFLVREKSAVIAAMIMIRRLWGVEVEELFVLPGYTSRGVGAALLKIALSYASQNGIRLFPQWFTNGAPPMTKVTMSICCGGAHEPDRCSQPSTATQDGA